MGLDEQLDRGWVKKREELKKLPDFKLEHLKGW